MPRDQFGMADESGANSHNNFPVPASRATSRLEGMSPKTRLFTITGLKYTPPPSVGSSNRQASCSCATFVVSMDESAENLLLEASWPKVGHEDASFAFSVEQAKRMIVDRHPSKRGILAIVMLRS